MLANGAPVFLGALFLVGLWKRSNIARVAYFALMNIAFAAVVVAWIAGAMSGSATRTALMLLPLAILVSNSWFVMFGKASKVHFRRKPKSEPKS